MKSFNPRLPTLTALLAGLLLTVPATAQESKSSEVGKTSDASEHDAVLERQLTFRVQGLTAANLEKVTRSLDGLSERVYACSGCKEEAAHAGACPKCEVQLELEQLPVLSRAVASLEESNIRLTRFPNRTLSYTALEGALARSSITIDGAQFALAGESSLVLRGGTQADVTAIQEALDAAGLFERTEASFDVESNEIHVLVHALPVPTMHARVAAVIEALDTKATLVDVIWGPPSSPATI